MPNLFRGSEYVPLEVINGFTKKTGIKASGENYASNEEMLAKLLAGNGKYDLIQPSEYTIEALIKDGKLEELNLVNIPNIENLAPEFTKLVHDDSDSPETALLNGDVDPGIVWSGEAAVLCQNDKKFRFLLPSEHVHRFIGSFAIPRGTADKENAGKFINYILRPEVSLKISGVFPYTNPNAEARKLLTKVQLENPAGYPPGDPKLETFKDIGKTAADIDKLVTDLKGEIDSATWALTL